MLPPMQLLGLLLCCILPGVISSPLPAETVPSETRDILLPHSVSANFNILRNITLGEQSIDYLVYGSVTTLRIYTGESINRVAMDRTLRSCRADVARAMYWNFPWDSMEPDPYEFPRQGAQKTGLELRIFSTNAKEFGGLTWRQLNATITGLQEGMFKKNIFREAQFKILDGLTTKQEQGEGELVIWRKPSATA